MQHKAMSLMSKKMAAAQALEGEFSADGLAAMAGEDNLQMSMAKHLAQGIDDADMQRNWSKVKSGPKKKKPQGDTLIAAGKAIPPSKTDELPIEIQMVVEAMIDNKSKPVPPEAEAEFPGLSAMLANVDAGFDLTAGDYDDEPEPDYDPGIYAFVAGVFEDDEGLDAFGRLVGDYKNETKNTEEEDEDVASEIILKMPEPEIVVPACYLVPQPPPEPVVLNIVLPPEDDGKIVVTAGGNGGLAEFNPEPVAGDPEPEPKRKRKLRVVRAEPDFVLTDEIMAKMFANMAEHGLI
jgi:hypothetical protein